MNSTPERDPENLERTADQIRADMDRTLDALERKLSPSQLLDRSLDYLRDHGGDMARTVGETVRRNPVPIVLAAAGIGWLVASTLRSRRNADDIDDTFGDESPYARPSRRGYSSMSGGDFSSGDYSSMSGDKLHGDKLQGDEPHGRFQAARDRLRSTRDAAADKMRSTRDAAAQKFSRAADATRERTRQVQYQAMSVVDEQPLLVGSIAIAIGAVIGALIPATEYEDRTVGQIRDRAVESARQMGERQYQNLRSKLETHQDLEVSGRAH